MAIIEIARIQVRRGQENQTGIPQLAGGEFAWAADTERLYIGLAREDGGSRDDNVEILTENHLRNFFTTLSTTATYIYRTGTYISAEDGVNEHERTIQQKLDETVYVSDIGAVGDGISNDTAVIQKLIDNLFLNSLGLTDNPARVLRFPAGTYKITETLYIPKNTTIIGEGIDKTVIKLMTTASHIFQTVDSDSVGGLTGYITFDNTSTINSNTQPDNVHIEGLTLVYDSTTTTLTQTLSMISLDCANNALIRNVKFRGNYTQGASTSTGYTGIDIRGYDVVTSENVLVDNCQFENLSYGIRSNYGIINPQIINNKFENLFRGITFNDPKNSTSLIGPRYARIENNRFKTIYREAVFIGTATAITSTGTHHILTGNQYYDVGNVGQGEFPAANSTPVIKIETAENIVKDEFFDRADDHARRYHANPNVALYSPGLAQGRIIYDQGEVKTVRVDSNVIKQLVRWPITGHQQDIVFKYNATNDFLTTNTTIDMHGTINIAIDKGPAPNINMEHYWGYTVGAGGLYFYTTYDSTFKYLTLNVDNPPIGDTATFTVSLTQTGPTSGTYAILNILSTGTGLFTNSETLFINGGSLGGGGDLGINITGNNGYITGYTPISSTLVNGTWTSTFIVSPMIFTATAFSSRQGGLPAPATVEYTWWNHQ